MVGLNHFAFSGERAWKLNAFTVALSGFLQLATSAPLAHTQPTTLITASSATLNGMAVANGLPTVGWFEWGILGSYNHLTSAQDLGSQLNVLRVTAAIQGLSLGAIYQCRLIASNSTGATYGPMLLFTTGSKVSVWGNDVYGQADVPSGLTNVCAITGGERHSLALRNDGTMIAWGDNTHGQLNLPNGLRDVVAIAGGRYHNLALGRNGYVWGWGDNSKFQSIPPSDLSNVVSVAAGDYHSVALTTDGRVVVWGDLLQR